ncbi:MAG: hypothetical protein KDJ65_01940 [Anaerolineae bacterium]|nr:hypothetical protein [Anaerolineae bacterium]
MNRFDYRLIRLVGLMLVMLLGCQLNPGPHRMQIAAEQLQWGSLGYDQLTRTFAYYVPPDLPDSPVPLVILLHGGGQNAHNTWTFEAGQRWKTLADEHRFILLLPEGQPDPNNAGSHHWNDCRTGATSPDLATTADDVGFILALINWAESTFTIDAQRICARGHLLSHQKWRSHLTRTGSPGPSGAWFLGPKNQDIDGLAEIWDFFARHRQSTTTH